MPSSFRKARKSLSLSKLRRPFKRSSVRLRSTRSSELYFRASSNLSGSSNSGGPPSVVVYPNNTYINFNDDDTGNEEKSVLVSPTGSANNVVEEVVDDVDNQSSSNSSYVAIGGRIDNTSDCIATTEVDDTPDIIIPTEETDSLVIVNNVENIPAIDIVEDEVDDTQKDTSKESVNRIEVSHDNENKPPDNQSFNNGDRVRVVIQGHKRYGMCGVIVKQTKCFVFFKDERSKETIKIYRTSLACISEDIASSTTATEDDEKQSSSLIPQSKQSSMISQTNKSNNAHNLPSDKPTDFAINSCVTAISTHSLHGGKTGTVIRHTAKFVVVVFKESSKERRISPKFLEVCYTNPRETSSLSTITPSDSEPNSSISTGSQSRSKNTEAWIPSHSKQSSISMISQTNKSNNAHNLQSPLSDKPTDFAINSCVTVISTHSLHGGKTGTVIRHTAKFVVVIFKELPHKESRISPKFLVACNRST